MKGLLRGATVAVVVVGVWWVLTELHLWSAYVLPPPGRVWSSAVSMATSGELAQDVLISFGRVLMGFSIAFGLAFLLAVVAVLLRRVDGFVAPVLSFLKNVPPLALIPLLILWFGIDETAKVIVIVLTAFFPMYMSIKKGLQACSPQLLEVGTSLHFSAAKKFLLIRLPHAVPDVLVGMRISLGFAWRALIGAEMIAAASGLGYLILDAARMSRSDKVIVGIVAIGAVGVLSERLFSRAARRVVRWGTDDSWS
jgi:sulfonate transport system permease protein